MRICPLHKTILVFEKNSKHRLICSTKDCPHIEFTSETNPEKYQTTSVPFWCTK